MKKLIAASLFTLVISVFFGFFGSFAQTGKPDEVARPSPLFEYSLTLAIQDLENPQNRVLKKSQAIQGSGKPEEFEKLPKIKIAQITMYTCFTCASDHTCSGYPTCYGSPTCVPMPTCGGATCGGATCGGATCGGATCAGAPTCTDPGCGPPQFIPSLPLLLQEDPPVSWITIMSENFEGIFPSGSWKIRGDPTWGVNDYKPHTGSKSAWCARGGNSGSDPASNNYSNNMDAWMIYGPFDLSDANEAELIFNCWLEIEENSDYFYWLASTNGTNFFYYYTDKSTSGWGKAIFDLTAVPTLGNLCGEPQVWIGFLFDSNSSVTYKGAFVDDILLRKKR